MKTLDQNSIKVRSRLLIQSNIQNGNKQKWYETTLNENVEDLHRMTTVVSDSNDAVIMHDFDGKILAWNRGAKETYGYTEAEALDMNVRDIVAEPDRKAALTLIRRIKQGETVKSFELKRITKDSRILDVWLTTTLLTDEKGNPVAIATTERDITERNKAAEALRESEERFFSAFEYATIGMAIVTPDGHWMKVNRSLCETLGYSETELLTKTFQDITHPDDLANDLTILEKLLSGEIEAYQTEKRFFHKSGQVVVVFRSVSVVRNNKGELLHLISQIQDITEQKKAEADLIRTVEDLRRMATVVSDSNDAVIMHDLDGKILAWNRGAKETYGYTELEALEMNVRDIVTESDREAALTLISRIKEGEIIKSFELKRVTKDGRILDVWLTTTLLTDEKGNPVAIATTERDITERKREQTELIAAKEKAEESDRLKSAFLANMSHEIRTPLNSIIGFSDLLLDPFFETEQHTEFAGIIKENGNNLLTILSNIMDISKIEAGQVQIRKRLFSANQLISDIQKEYSIKANEKGIELKLDLLDPNEVFIVSDEPKIRQVLVNLVENAIKFTNKGNISIGIKTAGDLILFHVKDTGIGVPSEFHEHIFKRFRQVESAFTRKYGGNGLGLSISKSLVELLGGTIWMESEHGNGSTFNFTMPAKIAV